MRISTQFICGLGILSILANASSAMERGNNSSGAGQAVPTLGENYKKNSSARYISVGFELSGNARLVKLSWGEGPGHGEVFVEGSRGTRTVKTLHDLVGAVRINSKSAALCYVRLFTTADTWAAGSFTAVAHFPELKAVELRAEDHLVPDDYGAILPSVAKRLAVKPPVVHKVKLGWEITRFVASFREGVVYKIREIVGVRGAYSWEVLATGPSLSTIEAVVPYPGWN